MKHIKLTQGKVAIVDDVDFERLNAFKWYALKDYNTFYAMRGSRINGRYARRRMHRDILNTPVGLETDHINRNGLDNRRENLRICNGAENRRNTIKRKDNTSGFKGVAWDRANSKWQARIKVNSRQLFLGRFTTKELACKAYVDACNYYHGEFASPTL